MLTLLRVFWPALVQPPATAKLDQHGVDLISYGESDIEAVVQCKGLFAEEGLNEAQYRGIKKSIAAFKNSPLKCREYFLIHNRDGRNVKLAHSIDRELETLIAAGKANCIYHWDRQKFLIEMEARFRRLIYERVQEYSLKIVEDTDRQFTYGRAYIPSVPLRRYELILKRGARAHVKERGAAEVISNIPRTLAEKNDSQWTLLTGLFGSGKTSAALQAVLMLPASVIYVHAGNLEPRRGEVGTNPLMSRIIEEIHLFDDCEPDAAATYRRLCGPVLRTMLSANDSNSTLILDALDENSNLSTVRAMAEFANYLADLRCQIVMTTREEHFRATFGNFESLFENLSAKFGQEKRIRLLKLLPWRRGQTIDLVRAAVQSEPCNSGLSKLYKEINSGVSGWPTELLDHPLFLKMIVDLAAEGEGPSRSLADLLGRWVYFKLSRDLRADRITPIPVADTGAFLELTQKVMADVAGLMVARQGSAAQLTDSISSEQVLSIAQEIYSAKNFDLSAVLSVSFLFPVTHRFRNHVPLRFTHKIFQEFYLARHLRDSRQTAGEFPATVQQLHREMIDADLC